ncbi:PREDICTED: protein Spindly-like [Vollenhovia emeryi]|uniref:protein Spindly-like n=1 Tax=Vollenhovia emeryi TaxID=411798 RepID=UPI0005F571DD|nr:PREDICTED: protein Spindly-like [Vollenhovia emeryi]
MAERSELFSSSANCSLFEQHLDGIVSYDDYKKLKEDCEHYQQESHVLRRKLEANDEIERELERADSAYGMQFKEYRSMVNEARAETARKHANEIRDFQDHVADLEAVITKQEDKIKKLQEVVKNQKDLLNKEQCYDTSEETLAPYKEKIMRLSTLLQNEQKNVDNLTDKLTNVEELNQELNHKYNKVLEELEINEKELEDARVSARELALNFMELESRATPASDTCKGNSLFAEVEDRRQVLLDKMKALTSKYNNAKRELNTKVAEVKLLRAEKSAMARKWEIDTADSLQENADLLHQYKRRIFELEDRLRIEISKNITKTEEIQSSDESFNYARSLVISKGKEVKELNEKIIKQAMQILVQEEAKNDISRQLRYWRSKAMSLEAQILAIKAQLETEQTNDGNGTLLKAIESCKISGNVNFEKACGDSELAFDKLTSGNNTGQGNSTETSEKPAVDTTTEQKMPRRFVFFSKDTEDTESKVLKKSAKQQDYPIVSYTKEHGSTFYDS